MRPALVMFAAACGLLLAVPAAATVGTLFLMKEAVVTDNAVCLDGTPGGYYYSPGSGSGAAKWLVYHEGGGWCESAEDCYGRSKTRLGSSSSYPDTATLDGGGLYFSSDSSINPQFFNWNMVYMKYCDGASFSGSNSSVTVVSGAPLHFRGKHVLDAFIADLLTNRGLSKATDLVVTGCSAGGLATYLHADKWAAAVPKGVKVAAMPDSGFFLDYQGKPYSSSSSAPRVHMWRDVPSASGGVETVRIGLSDIGPGVYQEDMKWVFQNQNVSAGVDQDCIAGYPEGEQWHCMFAEHTAPFIQTRIFPLQSEYDSWQIGNVLAVNNDVALVNEMGANITSRLQANLLNKQQNGVFLDSCEHHCGLWNGLSVGGVRQPEAFQAWYETPGAQRLFIQGQVYPCTACCNANFTAAA